MTGKGFRKHRSKIVVLAVGNGRVGMETRLFNLGILRWWVKVVRSFGKRPVNMGILGAAGGDGIAPQYLNTGFVGYRGRSGN